MLPLKPFAIEYGWASHVGRRSRNEDAVWTHCLPSPNDRGCLFAVADGMGGHAGGEVASRMACHGLSAYYTRRTGKKLPLNARDLSSRLSETVLLVDRQIRRRGRAEPELVDMGTTLSELSGNRREVGGRSVFGRRQGQHQPYRCLP